MSRMLLAVALVAMAVGMTFALTVWAESEPRRPARAKAKRNRGLSEEEGTIMVGLNSPWAVYAIKVKALFDGDDEVVVAYDNDEPSLTLYVENAVKADAIAQLFPETVEFGNVSMKIEVLPANDEVTIGDLFAAAFNGNPAFGGVYNVDSMGLKSTFALFAPRAVQYYSDDLREYGGVSTKTYADIARDVFDTDKITENIKISSLHSGNITSLHSGSNIIIC